jgi:hypothetical protein
MNERIKEIAIKAGLIAPCGSDLEGLREFDYRMFAKLIVKKFDDILVLEYLDCAGENDKKAQFRIDRLRNRVEEYFGVEE